MLEFAPKSHIMCLFLKKNMSVIGSYSIHLTEVLDLIQIADVNNGEVLDPICDTIEDFILAHAIRVPVSAEANDCQAFILGHDGLVDMPAGDKVLDLGYRGYSCSAGIPAKPP